MPTDTGTYPSPNLSPREIEVVLAWLGSDAKNGVSAKLFISRGTVNTHVRRVREKYDAVGRAAPTKASLLARALQDGLLSLDDL